MAGNCVCGSGKLFAKCCGRFLGGEQRARTPEQLMRSRYSAFALGDHGDYLLQTWFPATAAGLTSEALSMRSRDWIRLEVIAKSQQGDDGTVEFKAWYRREDGGVEAQHEKSVFRRAAGRWLYVGGEVSTGSAES